MLLILLAIAILALAGARRTVLDQGPQAAGADRAAIVGAGPRGQQVIGLLEPVEHLEKAR